MLRSADAKLRIDLVAPEAPRLDAELRIPPASLQPALAARAFAHLLRIEARRRFPGAESRPLVALDAPALLAERDADLGEAAEAALAFALRDVERVTDADNAPSPERAAMHALRLARLDAAVLSGYADARLAEDERAEDVAELIAMLDAVPWPSLLPRTGRLLLDPALGQAATHLADARADALSDGRLIIVKAGRTARIEPDDLRDLMLRALLARHARSAGEDVPEVREVGCYLARHGVLWTAPLAPLVAREAWGPVESWFRDQLARQERARRQAEEARIAAETPAPEGAEPAPKQRAPRPPGWVRKKWKPAAGTPDPSKEGKAERKKARSPREARSAEEPQEERPRARKRGAEPDEEPPRRRSFRPDWRKGSAWRRSRGK